MMNLPNALTCSRPLLAVVFVFFLFAEGFWAKALALAVFLVASLTDYWDGYFARKGGKTTSFGKLMDPIADKVLTLSAFVSFMVLGLMPWWLVLLIVVREVFITGLRLAMPAHAPEIAAGPSGKQKTALQMAVILFTLFYLLAKECAFWRHEWDSPVLQGINVAMVLILALTLWSGWRYLLSTQKFFKRSLQ